MAGYPHTRFRYKVEIDGLDAVGFRVLKDMATSP